jgi:hypothetical protein
MLEEIEAAKNQIEDVITNGSRGLPPLFVRLSFHDCVGGCDGCLDLTNPDNNGLNFAIDALNGVVDEFSDSEWLTRADIWVLAGLTAAEVTQPTNNGGNNNDNIFGPVVPFDMQFVGRPVCIGGDTEDGPDRELPSAHLATNQVIDFFDTAFEFTPRETVAIMGSHVLYV